MAKQIRRTSSSYVVPSDAYKVMERALVEEESQEQRVFVLYGTPGSGKTELISYFVQKHHSKYVPFVAGNSVLTL